MFLTLAQTTDTGRLSQAMVFWAAVFVAILVFAWIVLMIAKRKTAAAEDQVSQSPPFTLQSLRSLHEAGQLTDEEYEKAKSKIVSLSKASMSKELGTPPIKPRKIILQGKPGESPIILEPQDDSTTDGKDSTIG